MQEITEKLVCQSIDYILEHLNENITVKDLADQFHYSESNFSRRFKAAVGESVYAFIKRIKMDQSAVDMKLNPCRSITEIGLDYGYSPSNYSSAFKKHHASSPAQFRLRARGGRIENPFIPGKIETFASFDAYDAGIRIKTIPDIPVHRVRTMGNLSALKEEWTRVIHDHRDRLSDGAQMIERFYSDPSITDRRGCLCDLCISANRDRGPGDIIWIRGGKFALYRYEGKIEDIFCAVQGVFSVWLPQSGYEMKENYGLNIYRSIDLDCGFVVMELCIPIK